MELADPTAHKRAILEYWTLVEFFTPYLLDIALATEEHFERVFPEEPMALPWSNHTPLAEHDSSSIHASEIKLDGWEQKRRVLFLRRELADDGKRKRKIKTFQQLYLPGILFSNMNEGSKYEYSVLVTSLHGEILTLTQLYRDRATCENNFDELKNQWGRAGFVTQDLKRSQIMASNSRFKLFSS